MPERDQASPDVPESASSPQQAVRADRNTKQEGVGPDVEPGPMRPSVTPVNAAAAAAHVASRPPAYRCDLCRAADPEWCAQVALPNAPSLPLKGETPNLSVGPLVIGENGVEWLLCEICCALVEQDQWAPLVRRVIAAWEKRHERSADDEVRGSAEDLIERLRSGCFSDFQRL